MTNRLVNRAEGAGGVEHILRREHDISRAQVFTYINTPVRDSIEHTPHFAAWRTVPGVYKPEMDMYAYSLGPLDDPIGYTNLNVRAHHERLYNVALNAFNEFIAQQGTWNHVAGLDAQKFRYKDICKMLMDREVRNFKVTYNVFRDPNLVVPTFVGR